MQIVHFSYECTCGPALPVHVCHRVAEKMEITMRLHVFSKRLSVMAMVETTDHAAVWEALRPKLSFGSIFGCKVMLFLIV